MKYFNYNTLLFGLALIVSSSFVLATPTKSAAQMQHEVAGQVTDASTGAPLPGVNVVVKGTTIGTSTDLNGEYSLEAPSPSDSLVFSFVGYETQTIGINGRSEIDLAMSVGVVVGEEILVVGYGQQQTQTTSTGAVSSISGEAIVDMPSPNISQSLGGKIPGLFMVNNSGRPGGDAATLLIRGQSTLNNNAPLVVIDGIPSRMGGLSRLNPNDIANITVLKDATAAIYGARAGNGVILVTTKRGREGPPRVNLEINRGFSQPTRVPEMADAATYLRMINEIMQYRENPPLYPEEEIQKYENIEAQDPWLYHDTNWAKEAMQSMALRTSGSMSVSGGGEYITYRTSIGAKTATGILVNSSTRYNQFNFRNNLDVQLTDNISARFDIAGRWEDRNYPAQSVSKTFANIFQSYPTLPGFWPNGRPGPAVELGENPVVMGTSATGYEYDDRYYLLTDLQLRIDIPGIEGLSVRGTGAFDKTFERVKNWATQWTLCNFNESAYRQQGGDPEQYLECGLRGGERGLNSPELTQTSRSSQDVTLNMLAEYTRDIGDYSFSTLLGTEYRTHKFSWFNAQRKEFLSDQLPQQMFAGNVEPQLIDGSADSRAYLNFFTRLNFDYKDTYLLEFVARYDGSYIFPQGHRYGFFPAVSGAWRLTEENFFRENIGIFDDLKLRASWGLTGNDRVAPFQYLRTFDFYRPYVFSGQQVKTLTPDQVPNPSITWETAKQFDVGIDGRLLDSRLAFTVDYYQQRREDILIYRNASVPASAGMDLPPENLGIVESWGYDGSLSWQEVIGDDLLYNIILTGSFADNKIIFWDEAPGVPEWQKSTGARMGTALRYVAIGVFNNEEEVNSYPHWPGARPGDLIFKDVNGDGEITADDRVRAQRNNIPKWTGGLTFKASYKQFEASVFFQGAAGASEYIFNGAGLIGNYYAQFARKRWTPDNPDAEGPRAYNRREEYWAEHANTYFWRKTDYIRLKQVYIAYHLPASIVGPLEDVRVYANGFNLVTWTDFIGDPGLSDETSSYPQRRIFNIGVSMTF